MTDSEDTILSRSLNERTRAVTAPVSLFPLASSWVSAVSTDSTSSVPLKELYCSDRDDRLVNLASTDSEPEKLQERRSRYVSLLSRVSASSELESDRPRFPARYSC